MHGRGVDRWIGLAAGVLCHGAFAAAIAAMAAGLYTGMQAGLGRLHGAAAVLADTALVLQFPLLHSFFLARPGRSWLTALAPRGLGRPLATTTYAVVASGQILAVFALWSPSGETLFEPTGGWLVLSRVLFAGSWVFLAWAIHDAGTDLQTGFVGWWAVFRGHPPRYRGFPTGGLFRRCRQPVYVAFMMPLWTAPVWTPDRLAIAVAWSTYCVVGPRLKERRYLDVYGEAFRDYQARVPYMIPRTRP